LGSVPDHDVPLPGIRPRAARLRRRWGSSIFYQQELEVYQRAFAKGVVDELAVLAGSLCVDIGSNDGTLLTRSKLQGMRALGIEPTTLRRSPATRTESKRFSTSSRRHWRRTSSGITATNVFAQMAPLGEVVRGICALLDDDGVFITESHYLLDVVEKGKFDTVYDEQIRTYNLKSLVTLFAHYRMEVVDVRRAASTPAR
jgi:hypothetical protein